MDKRFLKRKRTMTFFIDAADEIIKEEGINNVTIRKVADKAMYNSATLYNYFENLDHLILFTAMRYIKDYAFALPKYLKNADNALDRFIKVWECFCDFAFKDPEIYYAIFFADLSNKPEEYIADYYKLFPEQLIEYDGLSTMLLKRNIYERGMTTISECVKEGFIREEDAETLNEMGTLLFQGILLQVIKGTIDRNTAVERTMMYIKVTLNSLLIK
ncbi:TetR/AcrR family transcriptional regulator [Schnuerera sp. xch1]|uniref:TetR/AcrR family transcriptional regulator n=1 Tax=Schnuerera sp. xch1 TaxID=2874283 RepID=UPI001CBAF980|nr:TetR/AcrR family transcriptional regulator [Schnuerera sp. xch1]MBZ2175389.1 TetR/AcrR family transcriptional regulator [Schnuerera sp. xch1]